MLQAETPVRPPETVPSGHVTALVRTYSNLLFPALVSSQKREALRREEEARKRREDERKNALKLRSSYSERHYESAMAKITKAAARLERSQIHSWDPHQGLAFNEDRILRGNN